jgi:hypothetical protein
METVSYLLRLSFERGIPIRGAVGYGRYYATERGCFLGVPIIEAYKMEKAQDWAVRLFAGRYRINFTASAQTS